MPPAGAWNNNPAGPTPKRAMCWWITSSNLASIGIVLRDADVPALPSIDSTASAGL